jgi:hypothetical protein
MGKNKTDIAQIPYITHEYRMHKAYEREKRLKCILIATNVLWAVVALILVAG